MLTQGIATYDQDETDVLGDDNTNAQRFDQMLDTRDEHDMSEVRSNFQQQMAAPLQKPSLNYNTTHIRRFISRLSSLSGRPSTE